MTERFPNLKTLLVVYLVMKITKYYCFSAYIRKIIAGDYTNSFFCLWKTTKQKKIYAELTLNPQTSSSSHPSLLGQSLIGHKWIRNSCVVKRQPAPVQSHKNLKLKKWVEVKEEEKEERMCFHPSFFKTTSPAQAIPGCIGGGGAGEAEYTLH